MPANVTHMLIAHKALQTLKAKGSDEFAEFAETIRSLRSHGRACKCKTCVLNTSSSYCDKRFEKGKNKELKNMKKK